MNGDTLRPMSWDEYIGQDRLKAELDIRITAAVRATRPLDHILLAAEPGSGKTSLATIIGNKLGEPTRILTMPITARALARTIRGFDGVLVLDECHRLSTRDQEGLLPLLEFGFISTPSGQEVEAGWLTVIACTTEAHKIIAPLWDRFPVVPTFEPYSEAELGLIVVNMARKATVDMAVEMAVALGRAALGTPRRARSLVLAYRALSEANERVPQLDEVLTLCQTSADGLTERHLQYLVTLDALGGTKGLKVVANLMRLNPVVVEDLERVLVARGFVDLTEVGREITKAGFTRLREFTTGQGTP